MDWYLDTYLDWLDDNHQDTENRATDEEPKRDDDYWEDVPF